MRLAALVSGGKDSIFATYIAQMQGETISCIVTMSPESDESMLYHHPNTRHVQLQAESMRVPTITADPALHDEQRALKDVLVRAKEKHGAEGVVHGGIRSAYQRDAFANAADAAGLEVLAPLWGRDELAYMAELVDAKFRTIITSVSADGLDEAWLGREITHDALAELGALSERFGFNPSFEGGEAETFVLDCPLFARPIEICSSKTHWDGYRGRFEILEASLGGA